MMQQSSRGLTFGEGGSSTIGSVAFTAGGGTGSTLIFLESSRRGDVSRYREEA